MGLAGERVAKCCMQGQRERGQAPGRGAQRQRGTVDQPRRTQEGLTGGWARWGAWVQM